MKQRGNYVDARALETADVILLASGGHWFEMLEQTEIIEVKQVPYAGDKNKCGDLTPRLFFAEESL